MCVTLRAVFPLAEAIGSIVSRVTDLAPHYQKIERRLAELEEQIARGNIFTDGETAQRITREHARLKDAFFAYQTLQKKRADLQANIGLSEQNCDPEFAALLAEERAALEAETTALHQRCLQALLPPDENDERNVIVEIRAGTGGAEAALFAGDLHRMYTRFCETHPDLRCELIESSPAEVGGFREIILKISGANAHKLFKFESGVHRVQRVPATEAQGRIHTSTATVAVLPEAREVDIEIRPEDLRIEVSRASGPGGQGVNTTDSAVQVLHIPTGMIVRCQDGRSQIKNKERALSILRSRLLEAKQREQAAAYAANRKNQVGTGERNEKIRTYNFPQNRVTDHRINFTLHDLPSIMDGHLQPLLDALIAEDTERRLRDMLDLQPSDLSTS